MATVKQLLQQRTGEVWTIDPDDTVFNAIKLMADKEIGSLLVMRAGRLLGILSERDYTRKVALMDRSSKTTKVADIMTDKVITIDPGAGVDDCMRLMSTHHIRHLPVIDETGRAVGVISILDVLKSILSKKEFEIQQLENYIAGSA
jgi:CBS domain-containing protein